MEWLIELIKQKSRIFFVFLGLYTTFVCILSTFNVKLNQEFLLSPEGVKIVIITLVTYYIYFEIFGGFLYLFMANQWTKLLKNRITKHNYIIHQIRFNKYLRKFTHTNLHYPEIEQTVNEVIEICLLSILVIIMNMYMNFEWFWVILLLIIIVAQGGLILIDYAFTLIEKHRIEAIAIKKYTLVRQKND